MLVRIIRSSNYTGFNLISHIHFLVFHAYISCFFIPTFLCIFYTLKCLIVSEVGYAQGMNDIMARFLYVMDSEVEAYWMFVKYMEHFKNDFMEAGMLSKIGEWTVLCLVHSYVFLVLVPVHVRNPGRIRGMGRSPQKNENFRLIG